MKDQRFDRSFQTDSRAEPASPEVGADKRRLGLAELLQAAFPGGVVSVEDRTGGGDHFQVIVVSPRFDGLSLVEQHRLVYEALAAPLADGTIHELRISTKGTQ
ncbi:MAG TPA: BolA family protein [Gaiellaceae bacterium]|nr:BolA family protein [Gaiellaceae bacterium]